MSLDRCEVSEHDSRKVSSIYAQTQFLDYHSKGHVMLRDAMSICSLEAWRRDIIQFCFVTFVFPWLLDMSVMACFRLPVRSRPTDLYKLAKAI